ncbi:hypothetical protein ACFX2J_043421 [Malus domestica]
MGKTFPNVWKKKKRSDRSRSQKYKKGVSAGDNSSVLWNVMRASIKTQNSEETSAQKSKSRLLRNRRDACSEIEETLISQKLDHAQTCQHLITRNVSFAEIIGNFVKRFLTK